MQTAPRRTAPTRAKVSQMRRDEGLRRVNTLTAWVGGGALVLVALLSTAVAHSLPGRSPHPASTSTGVSTGGAIPATSGSAADPSATAPSLQSPVQAPAAQSVPVQAPVVSGGS